MREKMLRDIKAKTFGELTQLEKYIWNASCLIEFHKEAIKTLKEYGGTFSSIMVLDKEIDNQSKFIEDCLTRILKGETEI